MAEDSGVTEAGLKSKLGELLQATHVEIEDMSGTLLPHQTNPPPPLLSPLNFPEQFN